MDILRERSVGTLEPSDLQASGQPYIQPPIQPPVSATMQSQVRSQKSSKLPPFKSSAKSPSPLKPLGAVFQGENLVPAVGVDTPTAKEAAAKWEGKPYYPIGAFYRQKFGGRVYKVPVALSEDCPNRRGIGGMQTCIFCDEHGSFAYSETQSLDLNGQMDAHISRISERFNADRFLIYFQAYTTTFSQLKRLKDAFDESLKRPGVLGLVVGTRPDCLSDSLLRLWQEYSQKTYLGVEFGVQSFDDEQLIWMRRGHTANQAIRALERVGKLPEMDLGVHLIFGWPTETDKQIIETAKLCNSLPISNVKLHNLHVLKNTPLEELYAAGKFTPIDLETYCQRVGLFLQYLRPDIAVHRLVAVANRWEELVAPEWTRGKMGPYQFALDYLRQHQVVQGQRV